MACPGSTVFDRLIAHRAILPYLKEFMEEPQLVNTWSISKYKGREATGWHNGLPTDEYTVRDGVIRSPMVNVVIMWDHHNARHYWMSPSIRERFTPEQRDLTRWMDYTIPDRTVPGTERIDD